MRIHHTDLRGVNRLTIDAVAGLTDLVEAVHHTIARAPAPLGPPARGTTRGITGLVYRSIRTVTGLVGHGLDRLLAQLVPELGEQSSWPAREAVLAALNGVLGDYLAASRNPLAIRMQLRRDGKPLVPDARSLAKSISRPGGKLVVLVHGLCTNDLQWNRRGHDHGAALARDLGYAPVYLHYNSGLHVSTNGRAFSELLETLVGEWPVPLEALAIVGHSMGGLVARSAHHYGTIARHGWVRQLRKLVFLGTPHHGAPLERGGNWIDVILDVSPYTAPFARLGKIRSAGITDLRYGNLLDEDWEGRDRFARSAHRPRSVPLPDGVQCFTIAATTGKKVGDLGGRLVGDGLVPLASALGRHDDPGRSLAFPESRQWIARGTSHLDLLNRPEVYARIQEWVAL
ncbi:MAG TPA: alpha/beta hydrolase [Burkholderiales bacterium]|nr:alpha/beta hydrolase [Burkholderiales bacterium]